MKLGHLISINTRATTELLKCGDTGPLWIPLPMLCKTVGMRQRYSPHDSGLTDPEPDTTHLVPLTPMSDDDSYCLGATLAELFSFTSDVSSKIVVIYLIVDLSRVCPRALATWLKSPVLAHTACA